MPSSPSAPFQAGSTLSSILFRTWLCLALLVLLNPGLALAPVDRYWSSAFPVGLRPFGVGIISFGSYNDGTLRIYAVVANSGGQSVSILGVGQGPPQLLTLVEQVPDPYGVAPCQGDSNGRVLVTSPQHGSVSVLQVPEGVLLATIKVGPEPYSAACYRDGNVYKGVVSTAGDDALVLLDMDSLAVTEKIQRIPESRVLQGLAVWVRRSVGPLAMVASMDRHIATVVNLTTSRVEVSIPFRSPSAVAWAGNGFVVTSSAESSVSFFDPDSYRPWKTFSGIPNPQAIASGDTVFVSTGKFGSVAVMSNANDGLPVSFTYSVPGATGLAAYKYEVNQRGPTLPGFLLVTSPETNLLFVVRLAFCCPSEFTIVNAASFGTAGGFYWPGVAPGSLASAFAFTGVDRNFVADSFPLPTTLGGVTLRVGGRLTYVNRTTWVYSEIGSVAAPLLFVGPGQVNFQVAPGIRPDPYEVAVLERPDRSQLITVFPISPAAPGVFTLSGDGRGQVVALNQDNSLNTEHRPARRGSVIQIYATGAGETIPPLPPGQPAPASGNPLVLTRVQPYVLFPGQLGRVLFSGMAPGLIGVWQINVEIPRDIAPGPKVPIEVHVGQRMYPFTTIAVE